MTLGFFNSTPGDTTEKKKRSSKMTHRQGFKERPLKRKNQRNKDLSEGSTSSSPRSHTHEHMRLRVPESSNDLQVLKNMIESSMLSIETRVKMCESYLMDMNGKISTRPVPPPLPPIVPSLPPSLPLIPKSESPVESPTKSLDEPQESFDAVALSFLSELRSKVENRRVQADENSITSNVS